MKRTEFIEKMSGIDPIYVSEAANYRPKRMIGIKAIVIAACLAMLLTTLTVWGMTLTINEPAEESVEEPSEKILSFKTYRESITDFKLSEESLPQLLADFDKIIAENDMIEFEGNYYIDTFMSNQSDVEYKSEIYRVKHDNLTVSTEADADTLRYLMLLSYLTTEENDSVIWLGYDYDYIRSNSLPPRSLFVSYDYQELGYENALEYHKAIKKGEAEMGDDSYYVNFYKKEIRRCTDPERTNLW